ncbi:MAG: hypothetical protein OHK0039_05510 [Bacteroidia bacterium]
MQNGKTYLIGWLLLLACAVACAQAPLNPSQKARIEALVSRDVPDRAPGVAFGIVQNGQIIYTQYAGYADLEQGIKIGADTRFNIASNAKQYTALAVLALVQAGKLGLEDDIRLFFPDLLPEVKERIQIRHLLTHASGIRDVYDLLSLQGITWWEVTYTNQTLIDLLHRQRALNFKPGTSYLYSNSNYILLAEIIAKVSGLPFADYLNRMFEQLGMPDTRFETDHTRIQGPVARPYFNFDTWTTYEWIWNAAGDGNLFTTLADQLRFEQIVQTFSAKTLSRRVIRLSQRRIIDTVAYGYGIEFSAYRNRPMVFHHGSTGAWKATFMRLPEQRLSLITLSNSGKTDVIDQNQQIADVLLDISPDEPLPYPIVPEAGDSFVSEAQIAGTYLDESGTMFQLASRAGRLYLIGSGRNDVELERESGHVFRQVYDPAFKQAFARNAQGAWTVTAYYPTHPPYTLTQIEADFSNFDPDALTGTYTNEETGATITLVALGGVQYLITVGGYETTGTALTPTTLRADAYKLVFNSPEGFCLNGGRIRQVRFVRTE